MASHLLDRKVRLVALACPMRLSQSVRAPALRRRRWAGTGAEGLLRVVFRAGGVGAVHCPLPGFLLGAEEDLRFVRGGAEEDLGAAGILIRHRPSLKGTTGDEP